MNDLGFIILRHVNSARSKELWYLSYQCIRKLYPENPILIIDDHSNYNFIDTNLEKQLVNTTIIKNTKVGRGEILPYLYYLEYKIAEKIIFLQDSSFITKKIDVSNIKNFKSLWQFVHIFDRPQQQKNILPKLVNGSKLIHFANDKRKWFGSTGAQIIISHGYLKKIDDMYDLKRLEPYIKNRPQRMIFERIIGIILFSLEDKVIQKYEQSYFGCRRNYQIGNLNKIHQFLNNDIGIVNKQFVAPNTKNSYNYIFKNDPCRNRVKYLYITLIDKEQKKHTVTYKENTRVININSNHTIESVYYGLKDNNIEVTELFKKYITKDNNLQNNLGIYKIKIGR
tara:strand:+ start:1680 stop:2696 length:1017 start_codon:yes stop_codon:yes gene_type:complete